MEELFGNKFSLLLWAGAVLCFVGFALQQARTQERQKPKKETACSTRRRALPFVLDIVSTVAIDRTFELSNFRMVPNVFRPPFPGRSIIPGTVVVRTLNESSIYQISKSYRVQFFCVDIDILSKSILVPMEC